MSYISSDSESSGPELLRNDNSVCRCLGENVPVNNEDGITFSGFCSPECQNVKIEGDSEFRSIRNVNKYFLRKNRKCKEKTKEQNTRLKKMEDDISLFYKNNIDSEKVVSTVSELQSLMKGMNARLIALENQFENHKNIVHTRCDTIQDKLQEQHDELKEEVETQYTYNKDMFTNVVQDHLLLKNELSEIKKSHQEEFLLFCKAITQVTEQCQKSVTTLSVCTNSINTLKKDCKRDRILQNKLRTKMVKKSTLKKRNDGNTRVSITTTEPSLKKSINSNSASSSSTDVVPHVELQQKTSISSSHDMSKASSSGMEPLSSTKPVIGKASAAIPKSEITNSNKSVALATQSSGKTSAVSTRSKAALLADLSRPEKKKNCYGESTCGNFEK